MSQEILINQLSYKLDEVIKKAQLTALAFLELHKEMIKYKII